MLLHQAALDHLYYTIEITYASDIYCQKDKHACITVETSQDHMLNEAGKKDCSALTKTVKYSTLCSVAGFTHGGRSSMVEHQIVVLVVAGSSPVAHPLFFPAALRYASVAQLDRAPDFESVGRRFESCRAYTLHMGR